VNFLAKRQEARRELLAESRKHPVTRLLRQIPYLGPVRVALLIALLETPIFSAPSGNSGLTAVWPWRRTPVRIYRLVAGQLQRSRKLFATRGLNEDHNHELKNIFKGAATMASACPGPFHDFCTRKIAAITLTLWKKGDVSTPNT